MDTVGVKEVYRGCIKGYISGDRYKIAGVSTIHPLVRLKWMIMRKQKLAAKALWQEKHEQAPVFLPKYFCAQHDHPLQMLTSRV